MIFSSFMLFAVA